MTKEANKTKTTSKKTSLASNTELEAFLKNQQNIVIRLKNELKSIITKVQLADCDTADKDKCVLELEQRINQREAEILKLSSNLEQLKEENKQILLEFNLFKEKFFQLETDYDKTLTQQKTENENLLEELRTQQATENQQIQELSLNCQELQYKLQDNINNLSLLNQQHKQTVQSFEQMKTDFEQQQNDFESYKKQVNEEKELEDERNKLDFDKLQDELKEKDEIIKQCIMDKNVMEKEKNLIIDGLNNKIYRIEKAFSQPTKIVPPMVTLPPAADNCDNNTNSESSTENVAISKPQVRKPLENLSNNENQKPEQNQPLRNYKFKRPVQPTTSSQQTNVGTNFNTNNRKRRSQPARPGAVKNYNEFSFSSTDDNDDDESNYNGFSQLLWRPNNECYVADTDASEGFAKPKRNKH